VCRWCVGVYCSSRQRKGGTLYIFVFDGTVQGSHVLVFVGTFITFLSLFTLYRTCKRNLFLCRDKYVHGLCGLKIF
jgi:hypothetical protein